MRLRKDMFREVCFTSRFLGVTGLKQKSGDFGLRFSDIVMADHLVCVSEARKEVTAKLSVSRS